MLPQKLKSGVPLGLLILFASSAFVSAAGSSLRSNEWHQGPLNCYFCDSVEECAETKGTLRKCENNDAQTCLTVFDEAGAVSQRGCSDAVSELQSSYCSGNAERCPSCTSSGCNVVTSLDDLMECVSCDSALDNNCVLNPTEVSTKAMCNGGCMVALYLSGDESHPNYHLKRSCLNDRDLDEQQACIDGSDAKCIACTDSDNCNTAILPVTRYNCFHCEGEGCEDPEARECDAFNENDQCFMRFKEEDNDLIEMGCISSFANQDAITDLIKKQQLYLCEGENCNSLELMPQPNECTKCSSDSLEACATKPTTITTSSERCTIVPYTECYQRVNSENGGTTERGCLSELNTDDFYNCLTGADDKCKICTGNGCNEEIIPEDRTQCHRCTSDNDSSCHSTATSSLSACPTYREGDSCVAIYEAGATKRGCLSELSCDIGSRNCQICKGDGCNTANVKKLSEEVYAAFQDLPLNCDTCSGAECLEGIRNTRKCEGDLYQDCLTVFDAEGQVVRRGCEIAVEAEYNEHCSTNPELCFACKSNGCNVMTDPTSYQECLYCDAAMNPDCLFNPSAVTVTRRCVEGCLASLYPRKSNPGVYDFVRTCFEDIELDDRDDCTGENNCVKCTDSDGCNTEVLPAEGRLSCNHCNGADCNAAVSKECTGYSANDQCYMYFNNVTYDVIRMGCKSEFTQDEIMSDIKQFFLCDGENCNEYENLPEGNMCYTCNSVTDENCATDPAKLSVESRCSKYPYTECVTRVNSDGHTERGCLYDLAIDQFIACQSGSSDSLCRVCTESQCNKAIFPATRQQCHRCNSADNANCEDEPSVTQACPLYKTTDGCVTQLINGVTHRACSSETNCVGSDRKHCRECTGSNCNTIDLVAEFIGDPGTFQELPLNCYHCNGLEECSGSSLGQVKKCDGNDLQTCTVAFDTDGSVIGRGCSDILDNVCIGDGNVCYDCKSSGCNSALQESDYVECDFCDSKTKSACITNADSITRTRKCHKSCMTALYPRTNDLLPVYELTRTCLDDMDLDDRDECESGNNAKCKVCSTDNCNKDDMGERKSCYHCSGDGCDEPQVEECHAFMDHDQCFVEFDEGGKLVEMGCKSKYDPADVKALVSAKRLWLCDEDNCNTIEDLPVAQHCSICNSRTDPECAIAPGAVESSTECSDVPFTQCYTRIVDNVYTERGCLSSLQDDQFYHCLNRLNATECLTCAGELCNKEIHPKERRSCHTCTSDASDPLNTCETLPQSQQTCLKYTSDDKCVSLVDLNGVTVRGCSSGLTCDPSDPSTCQTCDTDNCNVSNLKRKADGKPGIWQDVPLTCRNCNNKEDCETSSRTTTCFDNEYCMTVFGEDGAVFKRGCSDGVESEFGAYCTENSANCHNCNSNECNSATSLSVYVDCVYCDSKTNPDCVLNPAAIDYRRKCNSHCMTALYKSDNSDTYYLSRSCLDDKEIVDQQTCIEGDNHCIACDGAACNTALVPQTRHSCYSCQGDDCEDPETAECQNYKDNDQCFILYRENSDISQMGCVSDLDDTFVADNIHLLHMCSGDNCNYFNNMPTSKLCAVCNSNDDPTCASDPENIPKVDQCTSLPNTQCYTRVMNDGSTERGCVSSLTNSQMLSCLSGNTADCTTCNSDRCNLAVFPADRRQCHRCNTKDDPTCESSPQAESVCPIYSNDESCGVKLVNGHTYRGCSSEFQCDDTDKQFCRMCSGSNNCNIVDLLSSNIGYPGLWQGLPINCYTCIGEDCNVEGSGPIFSCDSNLQNCGTVFSADGSVVQRGCSDRIYNNEYGQYCDENPNFCKFCKSSGCNSANSLGDYVNCVFCDGVASKDCVTNVNDITRTRTCNKKCMTVLYPRNQEVNPAYELVRSCLDDFDMDDRENCDNGVKDNCKACGGASCNKDAIPAARHRCNYCSDDCEETTSQECSSFRENDQCFTLFDDSNSVQSFGCLSDLDTSEIVANKKRLLLCDDDNCNDFDIIPAALSCVVCNSTAEPNCATDPLRTGARAVCGELPITSCYSHVDKDGVTHRGCLSDVADDLFDDCLSGSSDTCQICTSNNCNNEVYPANRRTCIRCNSPDDTSCDDNALEYASICPIYDAIDSCVTKVENGEIMRGCISDFTCSALDRDTCRICEADNCNTVDLLAGSIGEPGKWQTIPLNCYTCEGEECISGLGSIRKCDDNNLQNCMTVFSEDGTVEKRGCSDSVKATHNEYCDDNTNKCTACKSNGCNNAVSLDDYVDCYFCDSSDSATCSVNFATTTRTRKCHKSCMVGLYPRSSSNDPAYELSRSCLDDLDLDDREACAAGEKEFCKACEDARCNTMAIPDVRHECYKCVGDDCEDAVPQECSAYHANDQCYILFDAENSVASMGCRSEYEIEVVTELIKQKQMILCDEVNCNKLETIPTSKMCSVCSSESDPRCATNPNLIGYTERCAALPYTDCFTRINAYGHTERGCMSALESETFYGCLQNTDGFCETCDGDKCNEIDVYPAERRKCHQCSSATDPLCSSAPNSNNVCVIYSESDSCITNLHNGITTRGCASDKKCDNESDARTCRTCNTSGCNTVNLEKVSEDGEPGRWQDVPLNCYTCKGEENCASVGDSTVCDINPYQNCMTVFNDDGKVIQRGCSESVEADNVEYCDANAGNCLACNSNDCNLAISLEDYVECVTCDTDANGDCVNNVAGISKTRMCHKHCMTALYPLHEETNPAYGLSRSCYDDMDMDDREACEAGNKDHCEVCSDAKCNTVAIPETRLSCNACDGDDCQDPQETTCATYRPDDKCYIRYDDKRSIVAMGCRSEFSNSDADYLVSQKRLLFCEGDNCNTFDSLPTAQTCALCNSRTDIHCAVQPENVISMTSCSLMPYTECYSRVLSDGATERGCLTSLYDDDFLDCLTGTSTTCHPCKGDNCNLEIYPTGRPSCHICDSSVDKSCEDTPNSLSICPIYREEETCVTSFLNDVTYRGCGSSLTCDPSNTNACSQCTGDGCNTINLAKEHDDNFGKWQDLPLSCLTCSGDDCNNEATTEISTCENNNEQDCMTVFDVSGKVVARGCSDAIATEHGSYCGQNEDSCYKCKSNECNTAEATTEFIDCVYCNSHKDLNCIYNPLSESHKTRKCQGACMTALYPADGSDNPVYDLVRTCLSDKETSDQTKCSNNNDAECKACTDGNCNVDDLPADRLRCFSCEGDDCEDPKSTICPLYRNNDQCFIWFDTTNTVSQMGCVSSFRNQDIETLIKTKRISTCEGADCNSMDSLPSVQKCAVCDSKNNVFCAINADDIGTFNTCSQMPYTGCFSKVDTYGATLRGCLSDLDVDTFAACVLGKDENCDMCSGDGCNRELYPADRQKCFTCNTDEDENCESRPTRTIACPVYEKSEACMTVLSENVTIRGCSSDLHCDSTDSSYCRKCFGTGCNSIDIRNKVDDGYHGVFQDLPLRCHACVGEHCLNSVGAAATCLYNSEQDCMTVFEANGYVRRRGCSDAVDDYEDLYCRDNPHLCFKCKSNECNAAWSVNEYVDCAFCNSETDPLCAINPENAGFATRSCHKECMVALNDGEVIRSCLDDKEEFVQPVCREGANGKECASCDGASCNKFVFPADRLKCHVCTGSTCTASTSQYCRLYDEGDYCFAKYENGQVDLMGCGSSQNSSDIADWTAQKKLYRCEGDECNDLTKLPTSGVCMYCDSSKSPDCAQNPSLVTTFEVCPAPGRDDCVTTVNSDGHTLRGCFSALDQSEQDSCVPSGTCAICTGEKCNTQIFPTNRRQCHICNSVADANCATSPNAGQICPTYAADDICITKNTDGYIQRGCTSDFVCENSDTHCKTCDTGDNCNTDDLTDSAASVVSSLMLTLLLASVAILGLNRH